MCVFVCVCVLTNEQKRLTQVGARGRKKKKKKKARSVVWRDDLLRHKWQRSSKEGRKRGGNVEEMGF